MFKKTSAVLSLVILMIVGMVSPAAASTTYYYAAGIQSGFGANEPNTLFANMSGLNPALDSTAPNTEAHTLIELAIIQGSGATRQIVEVGLRKATGDTSMKVFAYAWKNGAGCGYTGVSLCGTAHNFNECKTVGGVNNCSQTTDLYDIGTPVPSGTTMKMGMQYSNGDWWFKANASTGVTEWLGWIDGTLWTDAGITFESADQIQAFAEVGPGSGSLGCTDVGTGALPSAPSTGAIIGSVSALPWPTASVDMDSGSVVTDATKYNMLAPAPGPNVRTLLFGGPGAC